jgi:hypothetical protein
MPREIKKVYKQLPRWSLGAFAVDVVFFFVMRELGKPWCGGTSTCYRLASNADRFADYLSLIVAIMAILIPVSIELWRKQFAVQNLSPKSPLDKAWSDQDRMRYLYEPVSSMAIFVGISTLLPLFINSSALFYAAVFYGIFLLVYVFRVSFFKTPPDIYDLPVLNPDGDGLPPREIMNELASITLDHATDIAQSDGGNEVNWSVQLSEAKTLSKLIMWVRGTLTRHLKGDVNKLFLWPIFINFITKCNIDVLWLPAYDKDGELRTLFANIKFYQYGNLMQAARILKTLTGRFAEHDTYYETIGTLFKSVPVKSIEEKDLERFFDSTFRTLFLKSGENDRILSDNLPDDWLITIAHANDKMPKATAAIYLQWMWNLQSQREDIPTDAVRQTTETIFPEVEPILFAKFVILRLSLPYLAADTIEGSAVHLDEMVSKWHSFGVIGRTSVYDVQDDTSVEERFRDTQNASRTATLKLIQELGWFPWDKQNRYVFPQMIRTMINLTKWPTNVKASWNSFIDILETLFNDEPGDNAS